MRVPVHTAQEQWIRDLGEGVGQAALLHVCIQRVSPVEGIAFQRCVYLTFHSGKKWRFGVGAAVGRV